VDTIDYVTIQILGNAVDFGDVTSSKDNRQDVRMLLEVYVLVGVIL
jgi:hypothetical protein